MGCLVSSTPCMLCCLGCFYVNLVYCSPDLDMLSDQYELVTGSGMLVANERNLSLIFSYVRFVTFSC